MPIPRELYEKVKKVKTPDDFKKFYIEMSKTITEENSEDMIAAIILAAAQMAVGDFPKLVGAKAKAGAIMWNFIRHWMPEFAFSPLRILIYEDLLYPQFEKNFRTIDDSINVWIVDQAKRLLESQKASSPALKAHWQSIVDGTLPYHLELEKTFLERMAARQKSTTLKVGASAKEAGTKTDAKPETTDTSKKKGE